ncbi:hypothetical protein ABZ023_18165 [Streptomyces sp. NPDC006367]|uniref:hypothetical protein n=1 Tax=unclassified Streptomyces TaxID=2593676 RepID=UPI0033B0ACF8
MTRYGFAIKALPGGKPFGDKEDDDEQPEGTEEEAFEGDPSAAFEDPVPEAPAASPETPAAPGEDPAAAEPPAEDTDTAQPPAGEPPAGMPEPPADDARPWAGDMYDEGDETDPEDSFSAYAGSNGEQAWLDRALDGTLTGWVRDETGQVWRYTDPDAWAVDVDGAQMTRTHSQADEAPAPPEAAAPPAPADRGVQDSMFQ